MALLGTEEYLARFDRELALFDYNFDHFRPMHVLRDLWRTLTNRGVLPGMKAPDFRLATPEGRIVKLSDFRGQPVLIRFGSYTCPFTTGSIQPLKKLHQRWGDQVQFLDVFIRQAHPGAEAPRYLTYGEKLRDARRYQRDERIPWTIPKAWCTRRMVR